jgi:hypothetical protein
MDARDDAPIDVPVTASPAGERVATYWTLDGARHAVTHLAEKGFDPDRFTLRPGSLEPVEAPRAGVARLVLAAVLRRTGRRGSSADRLAASRFDVVCDGPAGEARHVLARWWDSNAQPAPPAAGSRRAA